jgi:methionine-R-sulfoxide reductase
MRKRFDRLKHWAAVAAVGAVGLTLVPLGSSVDAQNRVLSTRTYTKPSNGELRRMLTPLQYEVTQRGATEPAFNNKYWNHNAPGLYVDVATGEPLFASADKFKSGTGWPSFTQPVEPGRIVTRPDRSHGATRTEVLSRGGRSHLGHVFEDGPPPTGLRYCMNSAALRFIPAARLAEEGYPEYVERAR